MLNVRKVEMFTDSIKHPPGPVGFADPASGIQRGIRRLSPFKGIAVKFWSLRRDSQGG